MNTREYLGKHVDVVIDRPIGSKHPEYGTIYPVNYGFVPGTRAADGEEIDAYVLGEFGPLERYRGIVAGVVVRKDDNEDKLVVASSVARYSKEQIRAMTEFQERHFTSEILCYDYLKQSIRATAKAIIRRDNAILVIEEPDSDPAGTYYRLPGGGIDFRELSRDAVAREIREELHTGAAECKLLTVLENLFFVGDVAAHEVCFVYEVRVGEELYATDTIEITEDVSTAKACWMSTEVIKSGGVAFHPWALRQYL